MDDWSSNQVNVCILHVLLMASPDRTSRAIQRREQRGRDLALREKGGLSKDDGGLMRREGDVGL